MKANLFKNFFRTIFLGSVFLLAIAQVGKSGVILANWTYQQSGFVISGTSASLGPISPQTGNGSASSVHASPSTVWSGTSGSTSGNGSTKSFNSDHWAVGDYYQFQTTSAGYQNITLSWDQASSSTGPTGFKLQYSTDGATFIDYTTYTVNTDASAWSSSSVIVADRYSYDLSSITDLNNASVIYFRLTDATTPSSANGTDRNDNFTIFGDTVSVPEPAAWGTVSGLGLLGICGFKAWREHRQKRRAGIAKTW